MPAPSLNSIQTNTNIPPTGRANTIQNGITGNYKPINTELLIINRKLSLICAHATNLNKEQIDVVKSSIYQFLKTGNIQLKYAAGPQSRINEVINRCLMTIYVTTQDTNLQIKAKQAVRNSLDPGLNPGFATQIVSTYNQSKNALYPINNLKGKDVVAIIQKAFNYNFDNFWNVWMQKNVGPNKTFITGNFTGLIYDSVTGKNGSRANSGFPYWWNSYKVNPNKFKQDKPTEPNQKIDKSNHTISDIIKYIYTDRNFKKIDAFNAATKEAVSYIKANAPNPLASVVFDAVVGSKLDYDEIVKMYNKNFKTGQDVKGIFQILQRSKVSPGVDEIYKKYGLKLPPLVTWKSSDFNKGPSDRGELNPEHPEVGRDKDGNLSKIKYDKFGDTTYHKLQELRLYIRKILNELLITE